jgi:hypothetical protein
MILFSGHLRHAGCRRHQAYGLCRGAREEYFLSDGRERRRTPDGRGVPPGLPAGRRALENVGAKCCPVTKQQHEQQQKNEIILTPRSFPLYLTTTSNVLVFFPTKAMNKKFLCCFNFHGEISKSFLHNSFSVSTVKEKVIRPNDIFLLSNRQKHFEKKLFKIL